MKPSSFIVLIMAVSGFLFFQGSTIRGKMQQAGSFYPAEVKKVIDNKCYGCHSAQGKSQGAKDALLWDSLPNLEKKKLVATLDDIVKVLKKNEMPPQSAVKRNPEMKLLPGESKILQSWAESAADKLLK